MSDGGAGSGEEPTRALARFAARLECGAVPAPVREACKSLLLDALACALAGREGEETSQVAAAARALGESGDASIVGGGRAPLAGAAFVNGYLITAMTMCDVHRPTLTHVTPEVVPAALAVAEADRASGRALLAALAAGLETAARVGIGLDYPAFRRKGWHGPGVIGPFGAAAAVGSLRGFDAGTMARAFGLAGSQAAGTFAAWGTPVVKFHQCRAALSGLMAGLLAGEGFAAPEDFLTAADGGLYATYAEGGRPERATAGLGTRWELREIALRRWPGATGLQGAVTALSMIGAAPFDRIASVRIGLARTAFDMHGGFRFYEGKFEALLSAHYAAAAYLRDRTLELAQFAPRCYDDPALRRFAAEKVEVVHDPFLEDGQAVVELRLEDGSRDRAQCDHPLGSPENPLSRAQLRDKFRACAEPRLDGGRIEAVIAAVEDLEALDRVDELMEALRGA